MSKLILVLFVVFFISGCENENIDTHLTEIEKLINENKTKWDSVNISTYMFTYSSTPSDCGVVSPLPPVVISVVNNETSSVFIPAFGAYESSISNYLTLDEIFERMLQEIIENPISFSKSSNEQNQLPEFNPQYGYPVRYYVDKTSADCDAYFVNVTEFQ